MAFLGSKVLLFLSFISCLQLLHAEDAADKPISTALAEVISPACYLSALEGLAVLFSVVVAAVAETLITILPFVFFNYDQLDMYYSDVMRQLDNAVSAIF